MNTIDILLTRFNGQILISIADAANVLGMVEQTIRNKLHKKTFPVPTALHGSRRVIAIHDLAGYIDGLRQQQPKKTLRGRPIKAEVIAAKAAGLSVQAWREQQARQKGGA